MKIKYTAEEYKDAEEQSLLALECELCGVTFYKKKTQIRKVLWNKSLTQFSACSYACKAAHNLNRKADNKPVIDCKQCGQPHTNKMYCSNKCTLEANVKRFQSEKRNHYPPCMMCSVFGSMTCSVHSNVDKVLEVNK